MFRVIRSRSVFLLGVLYGALCVLSCLAYPAVARADTPCNTYFQGGSLKNYFEPYENAEYVDGRLVIHFRLQHPYDGLPIGIRFYTFRNISETETCNSQFYGYSQIALTIGIRNWSVRFVSPTQYEIWNDEDNVPETCQFCSGSTPTDMDAVKEVAVQGFVNGGFTDKFLSTSFPTTPPPPIHAECCSSVLFIPGIQASSLNRPIPPISGIEPDERLIWLPHLFSDPEYLRMDASGVSMHDDIYTSGIIREAYLGVNVYQSFSDQMDMLVSEGKIHAWESLPYDWRYDYHTIIEDGIPLKNGVRAFPLNTIRRMAAASDTGKVTLIAHSNGTLLGKALIDTLRETGEQGLVDRFIMVGGPQTGTPQAIASLLHGDEQGLPFDFPSFFLSNTLARDLSHNMPGAYNLLPSEKYFDTVSDPVITFDGEATAAFRSRYGSTIDSYSELRQFLIGGEGRERPAIDDIDSPEVLNASLLGNAEATHATLDDWVPPPNLDVVQIVGWGMPTIKGVAYGTKFHTVCENAGTLVRCLPHPKLTRKLLTTVEGDGTVVYPSAEETDARTFYFNIDEFNEVERNRLTRSVLGIKHYNLFESVQLFNMLERLLFDQAIDPLPSFFSSDKKTVSVGDHLLIHIQSPVSIDLYDAEGRHTGLSTTTVEGVNIPLLDEQIPGSSYMAAGEEKYVSFDEDGVYTIVLRGTGKGTATVGIDRLRGDTVLESISYDDIPVTSSWTARIEVDSSNTTQPAFYIDADGDGAYESIFATQSALTASDYLDLLEIHIRELKLPKGLETSLIAKLNTVNRDLAKENTHPALAVLANIRKTIEENAGTVITLDDAGVLIDVIEKIREKIDTK